MYKPSVRIGHGNILRLHLIPQFGVRPIGQISTMEIQSWVTALGEKGYAPHSMRNELNPPTSSSPSVAENPSAETTSCDGTCIPRATARVFPVQTGLPCAERFQPGPISEGIPAKDMTEMMGHADVEMQFTYTVGIEESKRQGAERLGNELVRISQFLPDATRLVNEPGAALQSAG